MTDDERHELNDAIVDAAREWEEIERDYRVGTHDQAEAIEQALSKLREAVRALASFQDRSQP